MLSHPIFSKRDAAIIALLVLCGAAIMIEAHHRILIVAPGSAADSIDHPDESTFAPAPADTPRATTDE
jgi:hypothetical protein